MSYSKVKIHQIRFRLGLLPRPRWGAYSAPQTPYLDLRGLLLREGEWRKGDRGKGGEGRERGEGKGGEETIPPPFLSHFKLWFAQSTVIAPLRANSLKSGQL